MQLPLSYRTKKYPLYELTGAGAVLILLIVMLTRRYVHFDWVTDTLWIASTVLLILPEAAAENPAIKLAAWIKHPITGLLSGLYLVLFHLLAVILSLKHGGVEMLLYLAATGLFGYGLFIRCKNAGIDITKFKWKDLLRYPHWPLTVGAALCLLAMFFKMSKIASLQSSYGLQFNYNAYNGWGYNNWGYNYYGVNIGIKGCLTHWGIFATLLAAFVIVLHIVQATGNKTYVALTLFFKAALVVLLIWWLFGARGYNALKGFGNIIFIPGLILSGLAIYLPRQLGDWIKKRGLIK